jgi:sphingolipid 8-(E)-desaturase
MKYSINKKEVCVAERSKTKILTEKELEQLKQNNVLWLSIDDKVYDVGRWLEKHPGGDLIIRHFLFRDCTDQFNSMHPPEVSKKFLPYLQIGVLEKKISQQTPLMKAFRNFEAQLYKEGYFNTDYNFYYLELLKGLFFLILGICLVIMGPQTYFNYICAACSIAFSWHQLSFVAHDTGHNAITHNLTFDNYFGICLANGLSGLSIGWWKDSHNVHHVVTNDPVHDPDIQHLPFLAVSEAFFDGVHSTYHKKEFKVDQFGKAMVSIQHFLYYLLMMFGRFNLYVQSIKFLLTNSRAKYRKSEMTAMLFCICWFSYIVGYIPDWKQKLTFILLTNMLTFVLHVQITLSHFAMNTDEYNENEDFVTHQMRTTMDVDCPTWMDWFHGGLQYQVIHHLFPRLPRHRFREVRDKLLPFFKEHGLKYHCYSFSFGNFRIIKHLADIACKVVNFVVDDKDKKCKN